MLLELIILEVSEYEFFTQTRKESSSTKSTSSNLSRNLVHKIFNVTNVSNVSEDEWMIVGGMRAEILSDEVLTQMQYIY